jgi:hypothetical protein
MPKKLTREQFIEKATAIHNSKYCYDTVVYVNRTSKVDIMCPIHGVFSQLAGNHLNGAGCNQCSIAKSSDLRAMSTTTFIERAKKKHGDNYSYEKVNYVNAYSIVTIICKKHGEFQQVAYHHLVGGSLCCRGDNIKRAWSINYKGTNVSRFKSVLDKRKKTNKLKYGVEHALASSNIQKKKSETTIMRYGVAHAAQSYIFKNKMKQTCLDRYGVDNFFKADVFKEYMQEFNNNLYGVTYKAQSHMALILPLIQDIDWLIDQYINQNKTAIQIANELGIGNTTVGRYLKSAEITIRYHVSFSYKCVTWLDSIMEIEGIYIQHALNGGEYNIPSTRYKADGYCEETNTIYEFHGDCWHGNPDIFNPDDYCQPFNKHVTAGELYQKTKDKENQIISLGYNLVVMWENNYAK